jgi:CSLREA domain-containing protein
MRLNKWLIPIRDFSKCIGGGAPEAFRGARAAIAVVMVLMLASQAAVAQAATITVNSLADPGAPGVCALRDAIEAANTETAVNGCSAGDGNDHHPNNGGRRHPTRR